MSKNTAPQVVTVTVEQPQVKKVEKRKALFGLSAQDLEMVVGGGGVIINPPAPKR
jgi:hypothetical protein